MGRCTVGRTVGGAAGLAMKLLLWWHDCLPGDWLEHCPLHLDLLLLCRVIGCAWVWHLCCFYHCYHLTGHCCAGAGSSCTYIRQCSGQCYCSCSMIVPGLGPDVKDGNSHNYGSGGRYLGQSAGMENTNVVTAVMIMRSASFPLLGLLLLFTPQLEQLTLGKKGLVCELGLVLELDPVSGTSWYHTACCIGPWFGASPGSGGGKTYTGQWGCRCRVNRAWIPSSGSWQTLGEKLIPKVPEMLLGFNSCANSIKGIVGHLLVLLVMVPLSIRDCKVCLSSPLNIIFSWCQPMHWSSASSVLMSRASR